jgi:hypothetical protein
VGRGEYSRAMRALSHACLLARGRLSGCLPLTPSDPRISISSKYAALSACSRGSCTATNLVTAADKERVLSARPTTATNALSFASVASSRDGSSRKMQRAFGNDDEVYSFVRRASNIGISAVAVLQSGFWLSATYITAFGSDPVLSPLITAGGTALSFVFVGMVHAYLSRSVARISVLGVAGTKLAVTAYSFGGSLRAPDVVEVSHLVGGPKKDDEKERHWTFGVQPRADGSTYYYVVDRKQGVLDDEAVRAICSTPRGGSKLMILAYKRQAGEMKNRWNDWEQRKPK